MKRILLLMICVSAGLVAVHPAAAQVSYETRATVDRILIDEEVDGSRRVLFEATDPEGNQHTVDSADSYLQGLRYRIHEGNTVLLQIVETQAGEQTPFLVDVVRFRALVWIGILFALLVIIVGGMRGARALIGLSITVLVLFGAILPGILAGMDPVLVTVVGSFVILAVNIHLTHGFTKSSLFAFLSTVGGLILVWVFAEAAVWVSQLSGVASEEASLLLLTTESIQAPRGLLLAGIILGAVGVLDDIAVTQTETVVELHEADKSLTRPQLFERAMNVGKHHIASVVNTLVLAYAGVALPIFLLFYLREDLSLWRFVNEELIAEEIIRTLAGTTALVLLVPLATWMATRIIAKKNTRA